MSGFMEQLIRVRKGKRTETLVACSSGGVLLCPDNVNRESVTFQNQAAGVILLTALAGKGGSAGYSLASGASFTDNASDQAWYGTGTGNVWVIDTA
jgi:hypothetical protein